MIDETTAQSRTISPCEIVMLHSEWLKEIWNSCESVVPNITMRIKREKETKDEDRSEITERSTAGAK